MGFSIERVVDCANHLGESPIWDVEEGRLYWVDGTGRRVGQPSIWRLDPRSARSTTGRSIVTSARLRCGAVAARCWRSMTDSIFFDFDRGALELIRKSIRTSRARGSMTASATGAAGFSPAAWTTRRS